jgi:hypothetical protein
MGGFDINNTTIDGYSLSGIFGDTKFPTGFVDRTRASSTLSVNNTLQEFSISDTGFGFEFYVKGNKFTVTGTERVTFADTSGVHYFYFDNAGDLQTTTNPNAINDIIIGNSGALVAAISWNSNTHSVTSIYDERHGLMDKSSHYHFHNAFGALWYSGGEIVNTCDSDGSLDSDVQIVIDDIVYADEDVVFNIRNGISQTLSPIAQIPVVWIGSDGYLRMKTADNFPFVYSGDGSGFIGFSGGRIPYNKITNGLGALQEVAEDGYAVIHIVGTNDVNNPIISILGQDEYATIEAAQLDAVESFNRIRYQNPEQYPFEFIGIGTLILTSSSTYLNTPKAVFVCSTGGSYYDQRRNTKVGGGVSSSGGGGGVTNHGDLTGLGNDDHHQYLLVNGTRSMSGNLNLGGNNLSNANTGSFSGAVTGATFNGVALTALGAGTSFLANDGNYKSISLNDLSDTNLTGEVQGSVLYRNATEWVVLTPGTSGQFLQTQGASANPLWATPPSGLTPPVNPTEDGYIALGLSGDLSYIGGVTSGNVLTWNGSEWASATPKKSVTVEFALTEEVNNTVAYFFTWAGSTAGGLRSSSTSGMQNANNCSPYQVPFNATIKKAVLRVYGVGVQNGSVTYPVSYETNLLRVNAGSETKLTDVDFSISNSYTVGTYSVGTTDFTGSTTLSVNVDEGQMLGMQFENGSSASVAGQTRMAFITLVLEER